jgi:Bacterial SH3 domain
MRFILVISIFPFLLITLLFIKKLRADKIEHLRYEPCYSPVPMLVAPDPNSTKTGEIPQGEIVKVSAQKDYWVKVRYKVSNYKYIVGWSASTAMFPVK